MQLLHAIATEFAGTTVESITEKLARCRRTLEKIQPGCTSPRSRKRKK